MGVIFDEPKYPVIDKAPGFWQTVGNFNLTDYAVFAGTAAICGPFGYYVGTPPPIRLPSMWAGLTLGATAGFMLAYQNSAGRLMGLKPNDREVEAGLAKTR
ncbi:g1776 [Coccomyxa elongata]